MKLNKLIRLLQKKQEKYGNVEVCISFNGCRGSGDLLEITNVKKDGYFIPDGEEVFFTSESVPEKTDKVQPFLIIHSDRQNMEF